MPNLPFHIYLARRVAERLDLSLLERHMGPFLLGSTAPDIRVITRGRREEYHFAPLDFAEVGAGVDGLFQAHPGLRSGNGHTDTLRAFMAGYVTHIVADETWIVRMYRPFFGNTEVFAEEAAGNLMDRALQLELDRRAWETAGASRGVLESATDIDIGFIPSETLDEWRIWVARFLERDFSWERLGFMARRISGGDEEHPAHRLAEEFLQDVSGGLEALYGTVPRERVTEYEDAVVEALVEAVSEYFS